MIDTRRPYRREIPARPKRVIDAWIVGDRGGDQRLPAGALLTAMVIDGLALVVILIGWGRPLPTVTALAFHLVAASGLLMSDRLEGSRLTLALSLVACLPLAGELLAALTLSTGRMALLTDVNHEEDPGRPVPTTEDVRRIVEAVPACEALLGSSGEDRQALLAVLIRRHDADAVSLLRWLVLEGQELAVEAALALEELSVRFETELDQRREGMAEEPSFAAALAAGAFVCDAIEAGCVDPVMMPSRAAEARRYFELASHLDTCGGTAVTAAWARLEIAAMHPEAAVALLNQSLALAAAEHLPEDLIALREEARLAAHETLLGGLPAEDPRDMIEDIAASNRVTLGTC